MTALNPSTVCGPSPSRSNPFARPTVSHSPSSFKRTSLLPSLQSPARPDVLSTPGGKLTHSASLGSGKAKSGWRLLWRGGLEIGDVGYRLEGITFFAQLSFPNTPSNQITNPFDAPNTPGTGSPFTALPSGDTDLCLSLESMRGRKYLKLRAVVDLPPDEVLDGGDEAGVQTSIASGSPLLVAYFTSLLCRKATLSPQGRTLNAIAIGLGDDLDSPSSTVLVYGQRSDIDPASLRLLVGRKGPPPPPPSERKVLPGEPLPRAPLFFPSHAPIKPPPPFPRNRTSRSLSRAPSVSSIYAPPQAPAPPVTTATSGRTPGRRGEKRPRPSDNGADEDEKRRKAGKIVPIPKSQSIETTEDEDIFGRGSSLGPGSVRASSEIPDGKSKRNKVSQQVTDNKATIKKQTMVIMDERGCPRSHPQFKEVYSMTTRGVYFAFRDIIDSKTIVKVGVRQMIQTHLDMYLSRTPPPSTLLKEGSLSQVKEEAEEEEENLFDQQGDAMKGEEGREGEVEMDTSEGPPSEDVLSEQVSGGLVSDGILW